MYETIVFDLDGTLLDTLDDLTSAVNFALEKNGLPKRTREEVRVFVGNGIVKLMERAVGVPARGNFADIFEHLLWVLGYALLATLVAVILFLRQMKKQ